MKTFRLFISSTFNDFRREREVLQTKVYPAIKEYASSKGYTFQPIDLRWGVSNEAQLDQKTLELCLSEVRACKTHLHPNFLIMIGDRYGWVPLPYAIEQSEFETLLPLINKAEDTKLLEQWYKLDFNQLPASYILKEREDKYIDYDTWVEVENALRDTLQSAVESSTLNAEQKRKYFLSATEAEVEEGIIPYVKPTPFQEKELLSKNSKLLEIDPKHVFGFFRDINKSTQIKDKFIMGDYEKAQVFKKEVERNLEDANKLRAKTTQIDKETLEESYLQEFETRVVAFLKYQIDDQKEQESQTELSALEIELQTQSLFAQNKRKDFLETKPLKELLNAIERYISDETQEPLIIYGASGRGKSSLMSKAIEKAEKQQKAKKTIYRFIGATPYSGSSKEILISIFDQLGIDVKSEDKEETFEKFSQRVQDQLLSLEKNVTLFIDAVDQLGNEDQFLWLPSRLPHNLKIIISALDDVNYKEDTRFFTTLATLTNNRVEIPAFSDPVGLLKSLLEKENRTTTKEQEEYFLRQFASASSPLYVSVASQEIKNWKSADNAKTLSLALANKGIIQEFITNLTETYHHHEKFVQKVLGYIYASRDGLSEAELLALISSDEAFVEMMAPETWHENPTKELPMVHWSRLHTQLKPFLSSKKELNRELMYFFHREFEDAIKELPTQREEHEAAINATQKLIKENQDKSFYANRWGMFYTTLITEYELRYHNKEKQREFAEFIATLESTRWIKESIFTFLARGLEHSLNDRIYQVILYDKNYYLITKALYKINPNEWVEEYTHSLMALCSRYKTQNRFDKLRLIGEESLEIIKILYTRNPDKWVEDYTTLLRYLAISHSNLNSLDKAIALEEEAISIRRELYKTDPNRWATFYTQALINLANSYYNQHRLDEAKGLENESLEILRKLYKTDRDRWAEDYTTSLNSLSNSYYNQNRLDEAIVLEEEALEILTQLSHIKPNSFFV